MKVLGIIAEYNPFHLGHLYHLMESKSVTGATHTVAVISGNFVQRGEPAIADKWTRAEMAIENGVDLVLEMPAAFSTSSAEHFGRAGVGLLDSLGIVDYISFGSETGSVEQIKAIADLLVEENEVFVDCLKKELSKGLSFPKARENALRTIRPDLDGILNHSNNILAVEYMKAAKRIGSEMEFVSIKRHGSDFNDKELGDVGFSSATSIRNHIHRHGLEGVRGSIPKSSFDCLERFIGRHGAFLERSDIFSYVQYKLRMSSCEELGSIEGVREGLENRLRAASYKETDYESFLEAVVSKRYPKSSVQRILLHLLLDIRRVEHGIFVESGGYYARVLGFNKKGRELLSEVKNISDVPIITNVNRQGPGNEILELMLACDIKATDLYMLLLMSRGSAAVESQDNVRKPYMRT